MSFRIYALCVNVLLTPYETKYRSNCPISKMLKGLLTLILLLLLALQPAGVAFAMSGDLHIQALPDNPTVFEIDCKRMNSKDCAGASQCLVSGHVGCDLNPFQPVMHGSLTSPVSAGFLSSYGLSQLPFNETSPPLRPPRHA